MSYTFSDQQTKLSQLLGDSNTGTDDAWPLAVRKKEINRGELRFALDTKMLKENTSSTVSSLEIAFPSDLIEISVLYVQNSGTEKYKITNDREISVKDLERYAAYGGDVPYYYIWEFSGTRKMKLLGSSGINGKTYDLYYIKKPTTELSDDTDTSLFPEEYREASVYYAAGQLLKQIGKVDQSNEYMSEYISIAQRASSTILRRDVNYDQPRPDFNIAEPFVQDIQGGGYVA